MVNGALIRWRDRDAFLPAVSPIPKSARIGNWHLDNSSYLVQDALPAMKSTHRKPPPVSHVSSRKERSDLGLTDAEYLLRIIRYLTRKRTELGMSVQEVARRAKVKRSVIHHAEQDCRIPDCKEFKAWAGALGCSWNSSGLNVVRSGERHTGSCGFGNVQVTAQPPEGMFSTVISAPMRRARYWNRCKPMPVVSVGSVE